MDFKTIDRELPQAVYLIKMSSSSDDSCVTKIRDQDERKESEEVEKSGNMEEGGKAGEDREEEEEEEEGEPTPARK